MPGSPFIATRSCGVHPLEDSTQQQALRVGVGVCASQRPCRPASSMLLVKPLAQQEANTAHRCMALACCTCVELHLPQGLVRPTYLPAMVAVGRKVWAYYGCGKLVDLVSH